MILMLGLGFDLSKCGIHYYACSITLYKVLQKYIVNKYVSNIQPLPVNTKLDP